MLFRSPSKASAKPATPTSKNTPSLKVESKPGSPAPSSKASGSSAPGSKASSKPPTPSSSRRSSKDSGKNFSPRGTGSNSMSGSACYPPISLAELQSNQSNHFFSAPTIEIDSTACETSQPQPSAGTPAAEQPSSSKPQAAPPAASASNTTATSKSAKVRSVVEREDGGQGDEGRKGEGRESLIFLFICLDYSHFHFM